jgi:hypothetical protein
MKKAILFLICGIIIAYMTVETWGLIPKAQDNAQTINEAIAEAIAVHEADPDAHLGDGESIDVHRKNSTLDHPEGSVVADKFQKGGLNLTCDFSDLARFSTFGNFDNSSWPGVSLWSDTGTPARSYITSIGSNVRPYINYAYDFQMQFSFFMGDDGPATLHISFGQISSNTLVKGISLDLTPSWNKVHWIKNGGSMYSNALTISYATWHTMRLRFSPVEHVMYVYLDGDLIATLNEPTQTTESAGADFTVYLADGGDYMGNAKVEYITVSRSD